MAEKESLLVSREDREILRELARRQLEDAHSPVMLQRIEEWKKHNNFLTGRRPMVHLELWTFESEVIPQRMRCGGEFARRIEKKFYRNILNYELFDDDWIVPDYYPVQWNQGFTPFGHKVKYHSAKDAQGREIGYGFELLIHDLHDDLDKLKKSTYSADREGTLKEIEALNGIFGDILPARLTGSSIGVSPTGNVVRLMGLENMMYAMYDYPDELHTMMGRMTDDYLEYFDWLGNENLLLPTVGCEGVAQGSLCYTDELPGPQEAEGKRLCSRDVWGYLDSQETVGVSPDMFDEFFFPYYKKMAGRFGLLSYGCCEPVHPIWERCISKLENLRKVSISPWCDEEYMGERLRGRKTVYQRKPSPNYLGVGTSLDEEAFRAHIEKTLQAAKGCTLEITQRDVYTIANNEEKARRYVEIIREAIADKWQG